MGENLQLTADEGPLCSHLIASLPLLQVHAGGGGRLSGAPGGQHQGAEHRAGPQQLGARPLGRHRSWCPGSRLRSRRDHILIVQLTTGWCDSTTS